LNKKYYDERKFLKYGIRVLDLYYLDGSNPPPSILDQFLREVEANEGGIAVHCKAGLGRTGTCIGCYLMKHYKFTAAEAIGWFRICRPGT
jgi:cell division cycle 14